MADAKSKKRKITADDERPKKKKKAGKSEDSERSAEENDASGSDENVDEEVEEMEMEDSDPKDGSILVVDHATGRRFAVLVKLTKVKAKINWLQWQHDGKGSRTYTRVLTDNMINRAAIIAVLPVAMKKTEGSVDINEKLVTEYITVPDASQLPPPNTNAPTKKKKAFEIDLTLPTNDNVTSATSLNVPTLDLMGYSKTDCWFGDDDIECSWNFLAWLNAFGYLDKDKEENKSNNGKTPSDVYLYMRLLLYVLVSSTTETASDAIKRDILHPFNEKADITKYMIIGKRFHLATMLGYTKLAGNTWKSAVKKIKAAGVIWLENNELVNENCVYIIIPPVKPTTRVQAKQQNNNNAGD